MFLQLTDEDTLEDRRKQLVNNSRSYCEDMINHLGFAHNLGSCEIKPEKNIDLNTALVLQRSLVQILFRLEFLSGFSFITAYKLCHCIDQSCQSSCLSLQFTYMLFHNYIHL